MTISFVGDALLGNDPKISPCASYDFLSVPDIVIYFFTFECGGFLTYDFFWQRDYRASSHKSLEFSQFSI